MPRASAADITFARITRERREKYLLSATEPLSYDDALQILTDLAALAKNEISPELIREEAEKVLLRVFGDRDIAAAFYEVRKYCA